MISEIDLLKWVCDEIKKAPQRDYNIFDVLGVVEKEVIMCRFLTDLINPEGIHGQGNVFLRSFVEKVLSDEQTRLNWCDDDFNNAHVKAEYPVKETLRRIDIVIYTEEKFLPIEVKINAEDQPRQCYEYWEYAKSKNQNGDAYIWYLTKYGSEPSNDSIYKSKKRVPKDKVRLISFNKNIRSWLDTLLKDENMQTYCKGELKMAIEQYKKAVDEFAGDTNMNIADELSSSPEKCFAGIRIVEALEIVKKKLKRDVMGKLEEKIKTEILELQKYQYKPFRDYTNENEAYPGLNYKLPGRFKGDKLKNVSLFIRIEIDKKLQVGIVAVDFEDQDHPVELENKKIIPEVWEEIKSKCNVEETDGFKPWCNKKESWNIYLLWEKYKDPSGKEGKAIPDFSELNDAAVELINKDKLDEFVDTVVDSIKKLRTDNKTQRLIDVFLKVEG